MKIANQATTVSWKKDEDGFLKCRANILKETIMNYGVSELDGIPKDFKGDTVRMYVPLSEIEDPESIKSLEGVSIVAGDHTWLTPELISDYGMGQVAGTPQVAAPFLGCDLMVTNPDAISAIENGEIGEISAAYRAETDFTPGTFNNEVYDAVQRSIRYNHIAVIPKGHGRGGAEVRILNQKKQEDVKMTVRIKLRNTGKYINVDEEAAPAIEAEGDAAEAKTEGMTDKISALEGKNESLQQLQAEIEELKGELSVYKEKLDELLSEEAVEGAAEGMIEEKGEADEIIENGFPIEKEKEKTEFKNSLRKVHGTKLHNAVLTAIGVNTEGMSAEAMKGAFKAQHQIANAMKGKKVVAGAKMIQNTAEDTGGGSNQRTGLERLGFTVVK
jgi:hypothetical protein